MVALVRLMAACGHRASTSVRSWLAVTVMVLLCLITGTAQAAETLPARLSDSEFWNLIHDLSEPDGAFQFENLLSNETDYPYIMEQLKGQVRPGRVYLGVGPEQNFNYIAAVRPKLAFVIDIRRQNLLEHLFYKALFELAPDRSSFVSLLFSRPRQQVRAQVTAAELFDAYSEQVPDMDLFQSTAQSVDALLSEKHHFALSAEDRGRIAAIHGAFREFGPLIDYNSRGGGPVSRVFSPSYTQLMTETDYEGREWSYLASEENYQTVRDLQMRNLLVPLTGDFGGDKTIRAVAEYLKDRAAMVSMFYVSNVEGYLLRGGDRQGNANGGSANFYSNLATMPVDESSTLVRWVPNGGMRNAASIFLPSIHQTVEDFRSGSLSNELLFPRGFVPGVRSNMRLRRTSPFVSLWLPRLRIASYGVTAAAAFLIRFFMWSPVIERNGVAPWRRVFFSAVWAAAALVVAIGFGILLRLS